MSRLYFLILGLHVAIATASNANELLTLVKTKSGVVKGKIVIGFTKKEARAFYGIPYAEPPIGKLRFKLPVPIEPWTDVFDATRVSLPCYQHYTKDSLRFERKLNTVVRRPWSENCLTLNIWTPVEVSAETPVIVVFHGGNFNTGTGVFPNYDLSTQSVQSNAVYISLNYRLGAFGFLSFGIPDFPGNLGLMDQHLALKWIHGNVAQFGGKASAIFLYGVEAGAASIGHQIIFSGNKGLFKTGIYFGGSAVCSWAWQSKQNAEKVAKSLSGVLGCAKYNLTQELECLQDAHPEDILDASLASEALSSLHFMPNIDGSFIKEEPIEALKAGRLNKVTIVSIICEHAGSLIFWTLNEDIINEHGSSLKRDDLRKAMKRSGLALTTTELDLISDWYLGEKCPVNDTDLRRVAIEAYSDGGTFCCSDEFLDLASQKGILTFKFLFNVPDSRFPAWIGAHDHWWFFALFSPQVVNPDNHYSSEVVQTVMDALASLGQFTRAKATDFHNVWPSYNSVDRSYSIWSDKIQTLGNHRTRECVLWNTIIPELRKRKHIF